MYCTNCGKEILETHLFCGNCGKQITTDVTKNSEDPSESTLLSLGEGIRNCNDNLFSGLFSAARNKNNDIGFGHFLVAVTIISLMVWLIWRQWLVGDQMTGRCDMLYLIEPNVYCMKGWVKEIIGLNRYNVVISVVLALLIMAAKPSARNKLFFIEMYACVSSLYIMAGFIM